MTYRKKRTLSVCYISVRTVSVNLLDDFIIQLFNLSEVLGIFDFVIKQWTLDYWSEQKPGRQFCHCLLSGQTKLWFWKQWKMFQHWEQIRVIFHKMERIQGYWPLHTWCTKSVSNIFLCSVTSVSPPVRNVTELLYPLWEGFGNSFTWLQPTSCWEIEQIIGGSKSWECPRKDKIPHARWKWLHKV